MEKRSQHKENTNETPQRKYHHIKSVSTQYSHKLAQAAELSCPQHKPDANPGSYSSKTNPNTEIRPGGKHHAGQQSWRTMRRDLAASNSGGGRRSHERAKTIPRTELRPNTSQSRQGEKNASTSNDATTAASKPLPVQNRRSLRGGFLDKTVINNSDGGTVYYKSKEIGSKKDDSSKNQKDDSSDHQDTGTQTYNLNTGKWESL
jgi:hypothetical protein